MSVPNLLSLVVEVAAQNPTAWRQAHTGSAQTSVFIHLLASRAHAVNANFGLNGKRGDPANISDDVLNFKGEGAQFDPTNGNAPVSVIDVIASAGWVPGFPEPSPAWQVFTDPHPAAWVRPAAVAPPVPAPTPGRRVKLGVSAFGALGLYRHDRLRFDEMIRFFRDDLAPDYARIFWYLADGPWGLVGTGHLRNTTRHELLTAVVETLLGIGVKPQLTVFGTWVADEGSRNVIVEQFKNAARPYASRLFLVDCYNEPGAIGVPEYGYVREAGRMLAGEGYPLLSLASPDTLHMGVQGREATDAEVAADVSKLYDAMPAGVNAITPHWGRHPWRPHRRLGPSAAGKTIINDEPRGYKSSVSAITDPADFGRDFAASAAAGEAYTLHCEPGIWHGYCDTRDHPEWEHNNSVKRWQDVPRIGAIVAALHAVRDGGTVPGTSPGPSPGGQRSLPDRGEMMAAIDWLHDYYGSDAGLQRVKGLWKNNRPDAEGIGAWILDVYISQRQAGKTDTQAKGEIVRQIELSDEWKRVHAA